MRRRRRCLHKERIHKKPKGGERKREISGRERGDVSMGKPHLQVPHKSNSPTQVGMVGVRKHKL